MLTKSAFSAAISSAARLTKASTSVEKRADPSA